MAAEKKTEEKKGAMDPLEEKLRKMRGFLAHRHQCAPYLIFPDKDIPVLMAAKPKSITALTNIKGFPADGERAKKWGKEICSVFNGTMKITDMNQF